MNMFNSIKPARILIVDDEDSNVKLVGMLLHVEGYATLSASNGRDALNVAVAERPDLILLDIKMPDMDGFDTIARLKADPRTQQIPVIMLADLDGRESKLRALAAGFEEFLSKPIDRADLRVRVGNLLRLRQYGNFRAHHNRILGEQVKEHTAQLEVIYRDTVFTLVRAAEHKEKGLHVRRISHYCKALAQGMDLPTGFHDAIYNASPMHDIGKIGIPDHVLLKQDGFTDNEWSIMRTHCALGASILASGTSPYTSMGGEIALNHHERWDGSGYPNGLKGDAIPLAARIMQVCDVYDALRSRRPYKQAIDHAGSIKTITQGDSRTRPEHFDPAVLTCFSAQAPLFAAIYDQFADE